MNHRASLVLLVLGLIATTADLAAQKREYVNPSSATDAEGPPYSAAVWVGDMLYLAGTIGLDENRQVPDTPEEEARLVLENMKSMLEAAGLTMDDLVTVQVFCSDVSHYDAFNGVYRTFFTGEFPSRAFVGVGTLLFGARFEVQGIASRR